MKKTFEVDVDNLPLETNNYDQNDDEEDTFDTCNSNVWRAFPVNIQTTLIYNTTITFLCHIFHFLSVSFYSASIFSIFLSINLYIRVLAHVF